MKNRVRAFKLWHVCVVGPLFTMGVLCVRCLQERERERGVHTESSDISISDRKWTRPIGSLPIPFSSSPPLLLLLSVSILSIFHVCMWKNFKAPHWISACESHSQLRVGMSECECVWCIEAHWGTDWKERKYGGRSTSFSPHNAREGLLLSLFLSHSGSYSFAYNGMLWVEERKRETIWSHLLWTFTPHIWHMTNAVPISLASFGLASQWLSLWPPWREEETEQVSQLQLVFSHEPVRRSRELPFFKKAIHCIGRGEKKSERPMKRVSFHFSAL